MSERYFVAIATLATPVEDEARALAADLGTIAYEERQKLVPGLPAIVLSTVELERAEGLTAKLRARGHRAMWCRASDVVASSAMTTLRRFTFEPRRARCPVMHACRGRHLRADSRHAPHARRRDAPRPSRSTKLDLGRADAHRRLMITKTEKTEIAVERRRIREPSPCSTSFGASGDPAWILHEQRTNFSALRPRAAPPHGPDLTFVLTSIQRIHQACKLVPDAARFDERLLRSRKHLSRGARSPRARGFDRELISITPLDSCAACLLFNVCVNLNWTGESVKYARAPTATDRLDATFAALADPTRRAILARLARGERPP